MPSSSAVDSATRLDPQVLKKLYTTHSSRHWWALIYNWLIIIGTILLCEAFFNPITYFLAVLLIGARMHALAILMHDAAHYRFLPSRKWNDAVTNWLTMFPLFTTIAVYRQNHLNHHRHLNTEDDPDWVAKLTKREFTFPKTKREFVLTVLSYLFLVQGAKDAIWFLKRFQAPAKKGKPQEKSERLIFTVLLVVLLTLTGGWKLYLFYWVVPYLSTFFMMQYIRSVAEHFGDLEYEDDLSHSRTVKPHWIEKILIAPHHVGYHLEHHLYAGVPFYHLPDLHDALMKNEAYREKAHITHGYVRGLLNELGRAQSISPIHTHAVTASSAG